MKWKETSDNDVSPDKHDPYYENDGYESFKAKGQKKRTGLPGNSIRYLYGGIGILFAVLLVMLIFSNRGESVDPERISALEQRIERLEQQLEKVDGVDEKVTRIWEQAKSFETFKTRFDRSEASMSLRMDHLAMSLDALQQKNTEALQKLGRLEKAPAPSTVKASPTTNKQAVAATHTVVAGDTLFGISRRYNLSVEELRSINKLPAGAVIHIGQTLTVSQPGH